MDFLKSRLTFSNESYSGKKIRGRSIEKVSDNDSDSDSNKDYNPMYTEASQKSPGTI